MSTLRAELAGGLLHRARIGDVQRHQRHLRQFPELGEPRELLPGFCVPHPHQVGAGADERAHERLADRGLAVGDQHLAELRIAGHFPQLSVVCHVGYVLIRKTNEHAHAGLIEPRAHPHARRRCAHVAVQVHDDGRAGIELHHAEPPGHALAKEDVVAVAQQRLRDAARPRRTACATAARSLRHTWQASRGGYCTAPQPAHTCSAKRPSAAAAVSPSATRLRGQGGSTGCRVRSTGFLRFGRAMGCVMCAPRRALRPRCTGRGRS